MSVNGRPSLDPRWTHHHRNVVAGFMAAIVQISRVDDAVPRWDADTGVMSGAAPVLLWEGQARCQPNKDWRARSRVALGDPIVMHALRLQIPLHGVPHIPVDARVRVLDCPNDPELLNYVFRVRNPLNSSNSWVRNILCDVDLEEPADG